MTAFFIGALGLFVLAFLLSLAVQAIRTERHTQEMLEIAEPKITGMYTQTSAT